MRLRDLVFLVGANLRRMKMRLALTSLGVVIGTSAIVLMLSLGIGLQKNITAELGNVGSATHIIVMGGMMAPGAAEQQPLNDRAIEEIKTLEHVETVVPALMLHSLQAVSYKKHDGYLNAQGVPMDEIAKLGYTVETGRLPRNEKEILLGAGAGQAFSTGAGRLSTLKNADLVGKRLIATFIEIPADPGASEMAHQEPAEVKRKLTVVGVLSEVDMQVDQSAFVTLDAAIDFNGMSRRRPTYEQVTVKVDTPVVAADVEKELQGQGYSTYSLRSMQEGLKNTFLIIQGVLGALGGIAMLVASLGIANTMTMSIYERTREIGIMKAVGASNRQIKRVFLGEAAFIGILGGLGGLLFSATGAALANLFVQGLIASQSTASGGTMPQTRSFFDISPGLALFAITFAAGVGLLAGVLPAVRAANLDPLTALRHE